MSNIAEGTPITERTAKRFHARTFTVLAFMAIASLSVLYSTAFAQLEIDEKKAKTIEKSVERNPLIIMVARGFGGACGKGCSEWIAVEGNFDKKAAQRVSEFITRLNRFDLPVFLNSEGGILSQAIATGLFFRNHKMITAVGRTVPTDCRSRRPITSACRDKMTKEGQHLSHLTFGDDARCASACVYAFIGGTTRRLNGRATLRVHSGVRIKGKGDLDADIARIKLYVVRMGVDPALVDVSLAVPFEQARALSRQEIKKFGLLIGDFRPQSLLPPHD